jgi:hypothetical protein
VSLIARQKTHQEMTAECVFSRDVRDDGDLDGEEDAEDAAAPEKDGKRKRKVGAGGK